MEGALIASKAQDLIDADSFRENKQFANLQMMINAGKAQLVTGNLLISNDVRNIVEFPQMALVHIQGGADVFVSMDRLIQVDDPRFQKANPNATRDYEKKLMNDFSEKLDGLMKKFHDDSQ